MFGEKCRHANLCYIAAAAGHSNEAVATISQGTFDISMVLTLCSTYSMGLGKKSMATR